MCVQSNPLEPKLKTPLFNVLLERISSKLNLNSYLFLPLGLICIFCHERIHFKSLS